MVAGFARYSVLNGAEIIRPKKNSRWGRFKEGSKACCARRAGELGKMPQKSGVLRKIFSLPRELKSGMAAEEFVLEAGTPVTWRTR
jgi:hypothetical protein